MDNVKFYNWNKIFDKAGKELLGNLKKGAQIGVLGTALTAGTMFGVGCSQPTGGNTIDNDQGITGGNNGNTGNTGNTGNNLPSKPYDRTIGNGNYVLHNFIGGTFTTGNDAVATTKNYLNAGKNYIYSLINQLNNSLEGRAAQNSLNNYTTLSSRIEDAVNNYPNPGKAMDPIITGATYASEVILPDIARNLNTQSERSAFEDIYRILKNEAYRESLGFYRDGSAFADEYESEKSSIH